jgi:acyl-CoA reductase-like NAD-dependent aldehyde dehydrogenase
MEAEPAAVAAAPAPPLSPLDRTPLPVVPPTSEDEVKAAVRRARAVQPAWEALGFNERARLLHKAARAMLERRDQVIEIMHREIGKFRVEILMGEALAPMDLLTNWIKVARPFLAPRKLPISQLAFPGKRGTVDVLPRGVVGIIAPWNFPLAYYFKPVYPALLAGNAVVVKPSEHSPRTADWFIGILAEFLPPSVIQCVHGDGEAGRRLIRAGLDALVFTGSIPTGRDVVRQCAEQMIPVSVELGGKDPALVLDDCDLDRTVAGVMQWALNNVGQSCGAIERVYVTPKIADRFVTQLAAAVARLRTGPPDDPTVDIAPVAVARQLEVIEAHVNDAIARGAKLLCGGKRFGAGLGYEPTVLDHCDHTMKVVTDETFGPVIPILRVKDEQEAIAQANDSIYGLNASVWTTDLARGERIARRLEAGTVLVNNHAVTGAMACVPWSGVKQSGFGIANSTFALHFYTRPRAVVVDTNRQPDAWWFPMDRTLLEMGERLANAQLGKYLSAIKIPLLIRRRCKTILELVRGGEPKRLPPA